MSLTKSAYLRTRGHQAAVIAEVGTQSSLEDSMCDRHQGAQLGCMQILFRHVRVTTKLVLARGGCKHVESICGL